MFLQNGMKVANYMKVLNLQHMYPEGVASPTGYQISLAAWNDGGRFVDTYRSRPGRADKLY
jgi:hypothetical protein